MSVRRADIGALTFDFFGTIVDWRASIVREGELLGAVKPWAEGGFDLVAAGIDPANRRISHPACAAAPGAGASSIHSPSRFPMRTRLALALALTAAASAVSAAPLRFVVVDQSSETLISKAQAETVWNGLLPTERLAKLYKPSQWGFASAVEGGFTPAGTCVVTARAMMLPIWRGKMQYPPSRKSTAFDAKPNLSQAQCTELATAKLKEAIESVLSGLIKE